MNPPGITRTIASQGWKRIKSGILGEAAKFEDTPFTKYNRVQSKDSTERQGNKAIPVNDIKFLTQEPAFQTLSGSSQLPLYKPLRLSKSNPCAFQMAFLDDLASQEITLFGVPTGVPPVALGEMKTVGSNSWMESDGVPTLVIPGKS